jgi:hypothetical protein
LDLKVRAHCAVEYDDAFFQCVEEVGHKIFESAITIRAPRLTTRSPEELLRIKTRRAV